MKKLSNQIYSKFISQNGSKSINIDCKARRNIENNLTEPSLNIFDEAENQVLLTYFLKFELTKLFF